MLDKDAKLLIVGGGTFGLSSALWLLRNGYKNVTVVDPNEIPSEFSAGCDINKIIQSSYPSDQDFTNQLSIEALEGWNTDPVFSPYYHETGIVYATAENDDSAEYKEMKDIVAFNEKQRRQFTNQWLETREDFARVVPQLKGKLTNWRGYFQPAECGWAHAKNSLISCANEISRLGGKFVVGSCEGFIEENGRIVGCKVKDQDNLYADKVILSAGASSVKFLDFKGQLLSKFWAFAHIKLTDQEAEEYKGIPVVCPIELGFFFEPEATTKEMKIFVETPGTTRYVNGHKPGDSVPEYRDEIPMKTVKELREFMADTIPEFKDRPFTKTKICWCTDTPDRNWIICEHPDYDGSLILATGDSGHGFKHMPTIGRYIARLCIYGPGALDTEKRNNWRWRPETATDRKDDRYGRGGVSDYEDVDEWYRAGDSESSVF